MKLFISFLLFSAHITFGQNYSFLSYSTSEGLPQSQVTCIDQDENGYLWIGTLNGLAKFNGKTFTSYSTENGLVNNRITSLSIINKELWVGHEGGISVLRRNGRAKGWQLFGENKTVSVTKTLYFNDCIVAATNGGGLYFIQNQKIRKFNFAHGDANRCRDLIIQDNRLYVATREGIYVTKDLIHFTHVDKFGTRSISGFASRKDRLIVSTYTEGLFDAGAHFERRDSIPIQAEQFNIKRSFIDSKGQIWLNSVYGVVRINKKGEQLFIGESKGLPTSYVSCIFEDREGIIWIGTEGKGLLRFTGEQFVYYNRTHGFPSDLIISIARSQSGDYLFGSYDNSLFTMRPDESIYRTDTDVGGLTIWTLEYDSYGNLWGGHENGLFVLQKNGQLQHFSPEERGSAINIIRRLPNGMMITSGSNGIGLIRNGQPVQLKLNVDFAQTLGTTSDFALYNGKVICAAGKGMFEINEKNGTCKRIDNFSTATTSLFVDDNNRLWIGTENGLFLYDGFKFKYLNTGSSSGAKFVNFLQKIGDHMYVGTNNGLYVFDCMEEGASLIKHYGINDGVINLESNLNSAFYYGNYLWFGTAEGLIRFDVSEGEKWSNKSIVPILTVGNILLNYQPFDYSLYTNRLNTNGLPTDLVLPYNKNNISIDLDGIMLTNPSELKYQFWLEGQDEGWSPLITNPSIALSNLVSGEYVLHIRAMNEAGIFSDEMLLPIRITPPFWRTWWFYTVIVIMLIAGVRSFFRSRIRKEREQHYKENLEDKSRLLALEQQSLNASMNRHFIFNSLNSIQYFINTQDRISANRYLTNFAKLIRKNLDSATEDDNMVTLHQELERLELYMSLEAMRFKDRFSYIIQTEGIDTEQIMVPAMLFQPFVENSIIHGILPDETQKGEIKIALKKVGNSIEVTISDNGIGIDFSIQQKHHFHGDHKSQGMEITSKRISLIRKMWKKDYELHGPYQEVNSDQSIKGTTVLIKIPLENLDFND